MCCKGENRSVHGMDMDQCGHHAGMGHGEHGCGCGGRRFLSRNEKVEMLEEYRDSLKSELDGVEEELNRLKADQ